MFNPILCFVTAHIMTTWSHLPLLTSTQIINQSESNRLIPKNRNPMFLYTLNLTNEYFYNFRVTSHIYHPIECFIH